MIIFKNMGSIGNKSDQPRQHKLYTIKKFMINEGISIVGIAEVNRNWSKMTIKDNIHKRMDGLFKQ